MEVLIEAAAELIERGLPIIATGGDTGKKPLAGNGWHKRRYSADDIEEQLRGEAKPGIGLQLGPQSCIDIEADSPKEEAVFAELFAGCEIPVTPLFKSSRGKHRLFAWNDLLANTGKGVVYFEGSNGAKLGIRIGADGKGAQSVIPPAPGRTWLVSPDGTDFAPLPAIVIERIVAAAGGGKANGKSKRPAALGAAEGHRNETLASEIGSLLVGLDLGNAALVERRRQAAFAFNQTFKPPLKVNEVETIFASILKLARATATAAARAATAGECRERLCELGGESCADLQLTYVHSDPPVWELRSALFTEAKDNRVPLSYSRLSKVISLEEAWTVAAKKRPPGKLLKSWRQDGGALDILIANMTEREADPDERRDVVVADAVYRWLASATLRRDTDTEPDFNHGGYGVAPVRTADGIIWSRIPDCHEGIGHGLNKITFGEIVACYKAAGIPSAQYGKETRRRRARPAAPSNMQQLAKMAQIGAEGLSNKAS